MAGKVVSEMEKAEEIAKEVSEIANDVATVLHTKNEFIKTFYSKIEKAIRSVLSEEDIEKLCEQNFTIDVEFTKAKKYDELQYLHYVSSIAEDRKEYGFRLVISFTKELNEETLEYENEISTNLLLITGHTQIDLRWITNYKKIENFTAEEFEEFVKYSDEIFNELLKLLKDVKKSYRNTKRKVVDKVANLIAKLS